MDNKAAQHYRQQQILNATPAESVVLLYDGAINFLLQARKAVEENRIEDRFNYNKKAGDIIAYLIETLDLEKGGEVAKNLYGIYNYALRRLVDVDMKNSVEPIDDVLPHLRTLKASWVKIANGNVSEEDIAKAKEVVTNQPTTTSPANQPSSAAAIVSQAQTATASAATTSAAAAPATATPAATTPAVAASNAPKQNVNINTYGVGAYGAVNAYNNSVANAGGSAGQTSQKAQSEGKTSSNKEKANSTTTSPIKRNAIA